MRSFYFLSPALHPPSPPPLSDVLMNSTYLKDQFQSYFSCPTQEMLFLLWANYHSGFPGGSVVKNSPANAGDAGSILGSGISPGEGNGNPLHYSYLGNPMDRGAWQATVHGVARVGHNLVIKQSSLITAAHPITYIADGFFHLPAHLFRSILLSGHDCLPLCCCCC